MTREEAKNLIIRNNAEWVWYETIDKIFDEFGEKLQDKDDEIELLKCRIEEDMKPKTCNGCKHNYLIDNFDSVDGKRLDSFRPNECYVCERNMQDRYEPKDNA